MNALAALFGSLIASLRANRIYPLPSGLRTRSDLDPVRKSGPRIDARKARRSGLTTHRQQKRERMSALRAAQA